MRDRIKRIVGESGMGDRFLRRTFSTFQLTDDNKRAAAAARRYKTVAFNWVKQNRNGTGIFMGLGNWTRSNSEICLLATKGKPKRISGSVRSIVLSPLQQHSRKPAEIRDRIVELMGDLPRIELFAREAAPGWDVWGNEAPTPEVKDAPADSVELAGKEETHEPDNQRDPAPQL